MFANMILILYWSIILQIQKPINPIVGQIESIQYLHFTLVL